MRGAQSTGAADERLRCSGELCLPCKGSPSAGLGFFVVYCYLQIAEEFRVLVGQTELRAVTVSRAELVAAHRVRIAMLVEADRNLEHQEKVIPGGADAAHDFRDAVRVGEGFIDGVAELVDQALEVIVEFQSVSSVAGSPSASQCITVISDFRIWSSLLGLPEKGTLQFPIRHRPR